MDETLFEPGVFHRYGRCVLGVAAVTNPKRPWAWVVCWSDQDGIAGESATLQDAQREAASAAQRVNAISARTDA